MSLFPACAGVILRDVEDDEIPDTFPRVCGGDPIYNPILKLFDIFSPRVRG